MQYELFYLVGANNEDKLGEIKTEIEKVLSDEGAKLQEIEVINKRKLSYEIKHQQKGTYITRRFYMPENDYWNEDSDGKGNDSMQRINEKMNLMQKILRFIIVKADELPELKQKEDVMPKKEKVFNKRDIREQAPLKKDKPKEESPKAEESIDKKLEEILNI